ncbi:unnamed protein product [Caenorhabditis angaria]|uniref:Uncharacterized protein n=1 Tax=Caenorhabditis angaria TaxID=860376 RepID=A0A9P1N9L7_9PELO|nr:unnamed protein product [Caenorhabditis angaria]
MITTILNPDSQLILIGFIYSAISFCVFPIYAVVIYALHTRDELKSNTSYKLINIINYCDLGQAICHFFSGMFLIFPIFVERFEVFVRIIGCTANSLWLAMFPVMSILSISRILIAYKNTISKSWNKYLKSLLFLGFSYIFTIWLIGCITQNFKMDGPSWSYDMDKIGAETLSKLELVLCFPTLVLSFTSYIIVIFSIWSRKRLFQQQQSKSIKTEVSILAQATILTLYMGGLIALWHNAEYLFELTTIKVAILNGLWIFFSFLNPVLMIVINSGARRQIKGAIFGDDNQTTSIKNSKIAQNSRNFSAPKLQTITIT